MTIKAKTTPGPWTVVVGQDALVKCPDGRSFNIGDAIYHKDNIANARLIAAAPDLLIVLRSLANEAAEFVSMANRDTHGNTNIEVLCHRIEEARNAILKAEGPQ